MKWGNDMNNNLVSELEVNDLIEQARANNGIVNNTGPIKFVASKFT